MGKNSRRQQERVKETSIVSTYCLIINELSCLKRYIQLYNSPISSAAGILAKLENASAMRASWAAEWLQCSYAVVVLAA